MPEERSKRNRNILVGCFTLLLLLFLVMVFALILGVIYVDSIIGWLGFVL